MSSSPTSAAPTAVAAPSPVRGRLIALLLSIAIAVALLAVPAFTSQASAARPVLNSVTARKFATNMLAVMNSERRAHHLKALKMNSKLILSAHRHNVAMAAVDEMSHQLPGEAFFADRISNAGYNWQAAGENIGWNTRETNWGLSQLQHEMYNEKAPNNGHRLNILSRSFTQVGIDVYFDAVHNKMWFTQDFGKPMH